MSIKDSILEIEQDIKKLSQSDVMLLCVTKTVSIDNIMEAYNMGYRDFGENKVQELLYKKENMPDDINWHLIGHLQTNKVNKIVGKVSLIQSIDSLKILKKVNNRAKELGIIQDILIEVNVSNEESKHGFKVDELSSLFEGIEEFKNIKVKGFMTMAPNIEDEDKIRWVFSSLNKIFEKFSQLSYNNTDMKFISMGMTHDYKIALEEGANIIRVGSKIFGKRK
ncbi:MAG: YggS family pyridoxal phosphate-dependent enzyme [Tissierellia bacterium]|nr:YggS family pyridoxal phosphate-dependent enzyme [Tissierellia bacterium]